MLPNRIFYKLRLAIFRDVRKWTRYNDNRIMDEADTMIT